MKLRAGVIGTGYLGEFHVEKYQISPKADLAGIYEANPQRAAEISAKFNCRVFASIEELLKEVDLVSIVVPTLHHFTVAKMALESGVHTLIEKPITATLAEADELIALAEKKGLKIQVGHLEQFNPAFRAVFSQISNPQYVESLRISPFMKRSIDVSVLLDLMIHDIHLILKMYNQPIVTLDAIGLDVLSDSYDIASVRMKFANFGVADLKAHRLAEKVERKIRVYQKDRCFIIDFHKQKYWEYFSDKDPKEGEDDFQKNEVQLEKTDQILLEVESFIDAIVHHTVPEVTGGDARYALAVALQATDEIRRISAALESQD